RTVLPQLHSRFSRWMIDTVRVDLEVFDGVVQWRDVVPLDSLVPLFEEFFFPQFLKALQSSLDSEQPNYAGIHEWFLGWRDAFPSMIFEEPRILFGFHQALLLIRTTINNVK